MYEKFRSGMRVKVVAAPELAKVLRFYMDTLTKHIGKTYTVDNGNFRNNYFGGHPTVNVENSYHLPIEMLRPLGSKITPIKRITNVRKVHGQKTFKL